MAFKELAHAYHQAVSRYDFATVEKMLDENYIQHNPFVPSGRAAFLAMLPKLQQHGSRIENVRILEDGPYVVMHHKWINAAPFGYNKAAAFHIIRFDSRSQIAEHWNVMREDSTSRSSLTDGETQIDDRERTIENKELVAELMCSRIQNLSGDLRYDRLHKVLGEGNFVIAISEAFRVGEPFAVYDLFRIRNQNVKEYWQISQKIPSENLANNNTMFGFK